MTLTDDQRVRLDLSGLSPAEGHAAAALLRAGVAFTLRARHVLHGQPDQQQLLMDSGHWALSAADLTARAAPTPAPPAPAPVRGVQVTVTPAEVHLTRTRDTLRLPRAAAAALAQYLLAMQPPTSPHAPHRHLALTAGDGTLTLTLTAQGRLDLHLCTPGSVSTPRVLSRAARHGLAGQLLTA